MATAHAPAETPPGALFVPAGGSNTPINLLVLLHGAGDAPAPFARLAAKLALPGTAGLALKAPFPCGPGTTWFAEGACDAADAASLAAARPALAAAIDGAGWPRHRVHLLGYGDGGSAALDLCVAGAGGVLGPGPPGSAGGGRRWGSCVTVGATLLPAQLAPADFNSAGRRGEQAAPPPPGTFTSTPILITRGEGDTTGAPAALAGATLAALQQRLGLPDADLFTVKGKAEGMLGSSPAEAEAVMKHWARCLAASAPAGCEEVAADG